MTTEGIFAVEAIQRLLSASARAESKRICTALIELVESLELPNTLGIGRDD